MATAGAAVHIVRAINERYAPAAIAGMMGEKTIQTSNFINRQLCFEALGFLIIGSSKDHEVGMRSRLYLSGNWVVLINVE